MCTALLQDGGEGEVDPFVTLTLEDPTAEDETHTSPIIMNENSPRWNIKYEFVMVSATSTLTAVVWDKQGLFNGIMAVPKLLLGESCTLHFIFSAAFSLQCLMHCK